MYATDIYLLPPEKKKGGTELIISKKVHSHSGSFALPFDCRFAKMRSFNDPMSLPYRSPSISTSGIKKRQKTMFLTSQLETHLRLLSYIETGNTSC